MARSQQRERIVIVIADNLKTHTSAGSLLVRGILTELKERLCLVYTPAYDPDANRIEWLWRVSRQAVTHHHHRSTFDFLLADKEALLSLTLATLSTKTALCLECLAVEPLSLWRLEISLRELHLECSS